MPTPTVENYIKRLYVEQQKLGEDQLIPMGRLAELMAVVPGTATSMVKTLAEARLVDYEPRTGVRLTPQGRALALRVLRRHRIIEAFLVENSLQRRGLLEGDRRERRSSADGLPVPGHLLHQLR